MTLRCLFVDFNSYFASVEQFDREELRDRPVGVVPVMAATTCCIAASREAKVHGVKTGTPVHEALRLCPDIRIVQARPARYVELHHRLIAAIQDCIPIDGKPLSIDEVACRLIGRERQRENAVAIARKIKQTLIDRGLSPAIRCSIGIAPNTFLAKTASDLDKVDGLTVIELDDLPRALHGLALHDLCGVGPSMLQRLNDAGIDSVEQLAAAPRERLKAIWGGIEGERFWAQLRGIEPPSRQRSAVGSVGHSHVLDPQMRTAEGMRSVLFKLLAKAAMRLRQEQCQARGLSLHVRFVGREQRYSRDLSFAALDDTPTLLQLMAGALEPLLRAAASGRWPVKRHPPLSVAVSLIDLQPNAGETASLFSERQRSRELTRVLDQINQRYGNNRLYFGAMQDALAQGAAPMRIPFQHIPDEASEADLGAAALVADPSMDELWLQRERQFKAMAENAHRQTRERTSSATRPAAATPPAPTPPGHQPSGVGGWVRKRRKHEGHGPGTTGSLF
ncbi:DNA polymerase Y family protein [Lysobacter firmicutimachus]|uniref:UmuC domain-containing protein n=1 Tax=Lysobacter firmicutimachus TaxID=1792846 RepID=A0ABU8D6H8_9GAMM